MNDQHVHFIEDITLDYTEAEYERVFKEKFNPRYGDNKIIRRDRELDCVNFTVPCERRVYWCYASPSANFMSDTAVPLTNDPDEVTCPGCKASWLFIDMQLESQFEE